MSPVSLKIGLGLVAVVGTLQLLQARAVVNSLVLFAAAGIIPGTNIALPPTFMMAVSAAILACGITWVLVRLMRSVGPSPDVDSVRLSKARLIEAGVTLWGELGAIFGALQFVVCATHAALVWIWLEIPLLWRTGVVDAMEEWEWSKQRLLRHSRWLAIRAKQSPVPAMALTVIGVSIHMYILWATMVHARWTLFFLGDAA